MKTQPRRCRVLCVAAAICFIICCAMWAIYLLGVQQGLKRIALHVQTHSALQSTAGANPYLKAALPGELKLLTCRNQSNCIQPAGLQLQKIFKVYLCEHRSERFGQTYATRFHQLVNEGLQQHPKVQLVPFSFIDAADFIVYLPLSSLWRQTECTNASFGEKLIVLDEDDRYKYFFSPFPEYVAKNGTRLRIWYFQYFKRSFVQRRDGEFLGLASPLWNAPEVYPLTYAAADSYAAVRFRFHRDIELLCTLRPNELSPTRNRAVRWVREYAHSRHVISFVGNEVNTQTRTTLDSAYFQQMYNAQIIVTVNPAFWEGDFRLWEAMCTGALVFVDPLFVPHPHPLIGGQHVVFFDNNNKSDLFHKLDYYRSNEVEARRIAIAGYLHAMKYHRTVNMVDYFLRSAHTKQAMLAAATAATSAGGSSGSSTGAVLPHYTYTGQYLNYEAHRQEIAMRNCHVPGVYEEKACSYDCEDEESYSPYAVRRVACSKRQRSKETHDSRPPLEVTTQPDEASQHQLPR